MAFTEEIKGWTKSRPIWARTLNDRRWKEAVSEGWDLETIPISVLYRLVDPPGAGKRHSRLMDVAARDPVKRGMTCFSVFP